jgi:hypothetical protein
LASPARASVDFVVGIEVDHSNQTAGLYTVLAMDL